MYTEHRYTAYKQPYRETENNYFVSFKSKEIHEKNGRVFSMCVDEKH